MKDLFPFQYEGAKWLTTKRFALLADEMGLGKTAQIIHASDILAAKQVLICCPAIGRENWRDEFNLWSVAGHTITPIMSRKQDIDVTKSLSISYDLIPHHIETLKTIKPDILILDESHYLKSLDAARAKHVLGTGGLIHNAKRVWEISGTPAPNHAGELWARLYVFGQIKLNYEQFIKRYCNTYFDGFRLRITGTKKENTPELRAILNKYMLRRKKEDVMKDLPPIMCRHIYLEPGEVDFDMFKGTINYSFPHDNRKEYFDKVEKEKTLVESAINLTGLGYDGMKALDAIKDSVSTLRQYTGLQLIDPVIELVTDELTRKAYTKIVLFCIHRDVIETLRREFAQKGFDVVTLYGGTTPENRTRNIERFQKNPKCQIFIGNIGACGTTITLTSAHNVIMVESDWVPGNNAQAVMRVHRIGQTKPVLVRFVAIKNSIHEKIIHALKRKTEEIAQLFDTSAD